jgi:hypothetical protein
VQIQETLSGLTTDADIAALDNVRTGIKKLQAEADVGAELEGSSLDAKLKKIEQMVVELHPPHDFSQIQRLAKTHWLVHVHANNYGGMFHVTENIVMPRVFECTFVRKKDGEQLELNTQPFPTEFDQPNTRDRPDYRLAGYPFVNC